MMLTFFEISIISVSDFIFWTAAYAVIYLSRLVMVTANYLGPVVLTSLIGSGVSIFFNDRSSEFYWRKFKKHPVKILNKLHSSYLFQVGLKAVAAFIALLFGILALLSCLCIIAPPDGTHFIEALTPEKIFMSVGCLAIFMVIIIYVKAVIYHWMGAIKSFGQFKLRMIIW